MSAWEKAIYYANDRRTISQSNDVNLAAFWYKRVACFRRTERSEKFMRINCWLLLRHLWLCQGFFLHPGELRKDIHSSCARLICKCRLTSRSVGCWIPSCCHWRSTVVDLWRAVSEWKGLEEHNRKDRTAVPIVKFSVKVWKWKWRYVSRSFLFGMLSGNRRSVFRRNRRGADRVVFASWPRNTAWKYFDDLLWLNPC